MVAAPSRLSADCEPASLGWVNAWEPIHAGAGAPGRRHAWEPASHVQRGRVVLAQAPVQDGLVMGHGLVGHANGRERARSAIATVTCSG